MASDRCSRSLLEAFSSREPAGPRACFARKRSELGLNRTLVRESVAPNRDCTAQSLLDPVSLNTSARAPPNSPPNSWAWIDFEMRCLVVADLHSSLPPFYTLLHSP